MDKELKQLEDRVKKLEKNSSNLFNSSYNNVGSSTSDFLIKTRGKVKIQWGNKFIDLLKDGELNVDAKFIYKAQEVGSKDGIYVIGSGDSAQIILVSGGSQITLKDNSEIGTTYVSFLGEQETTSDQKYTALKNIGFIYKDLSDINSNSLQNGIVYIENESKLYLIKNGETSTFSVDFPNPYTKQFIISKNDDIKGALVIKGTGDKNSLMFDSLSIYSAGSSNYINTSGSLCFTMGESEKLVINDSQAVFSTSVVSQTFQSKSASADSGFRLYINSEGSTLEVDNLIVRNSTDSIKEFICPSYWYKENNIISKAKDRSNNKYELTLEYENKFKVNDLLYVYTSFENKLILVYLRVDSSSNNIITVSVQNTEEAPSQLNKYIQYKTVYLIASNQEISLLKRSSENIDLLKSTSFDDEQNLKKVTTRIGNVEELGLKGKESNKETVIKGTGIYSDNGCFLKAQYTSNYDLPTNDSSTKFASTEWVNKLIPKGSIIMFNGLSSEIPEGWHICDGTSGTPNLIGKFIKADISSGTEGGKSEIEILEENMPEHTHTFIGSTVATSEAGEHTHTFRGKYGKSSNASDIDVIVTGDGTITTSTSGIHSHTIDMSSIQLSSSGEGKPIEWEPLYYSLIYIMKIV